MVAHLFGKTKIPCQLPRGIENIIEKLKRSKNKKTCLKRAYRIITKRFKGCRVYIQFFDLFVRDPHKLWRKKKLHCTNLNYLMRILLIRSGHFRESDIRLRLTAIGGFALHQYLRVKISKKKSVNVDPWADARGITFGNHA